MSQPEDQLAAAIKAKAQHLGFQLVGITSPDPPHTWKYMNPGWLRAGMPACFIWLLKEPANGELTHAGFSLNVVPSWF